MKLIFLVFSAAGERFEHTAAFAEGMVSSAEEAA